MTSPQNTLLLPRALIFLASIWLIGSWVLAIGLRPPVQPSSSSYEPGVRLMLLCVTTGLMIGWPLLRLSQVATRFPLRQTLLDLLVLLAMVQVVLWPLRLVTTWSPQRTAAIDATMAGWLLLAGAAIGASISSSRMGPRSLGMLMCVGMCLLGPTLAWLGSMDGVNTYQLVEMSPFMAIGTLGEGGGAPLLAAHWRWIWLLLAAGVAVWTMLWLWTVLRGPAQADKADPTDPADARHMTVTASQAGAVIDPGWWPVAVVTAEFLIRLLLIGFILLRREPRGATNLTWITIILLLPVVGMVAYLLVGEVRLGRRRLARHRRIIEQISNPKAFHPVRAAAEQTSIPYAFQPVETLSEMIGNNSAVGGNVLQLIGDSGLFIDSLVNDINEAKTHCNLLFYLFLDDHSGRRVAKALMDAAGRGVPARLLVDAVGSRPFCRSALARSMREAGVSVVEALPTNPLRLLLARLDLRNHRKIAVIDGRVGYMGSHNVADAEFAIKPKYAPWVDAMVRAHGPAVYDLQVLFIEDWYLDTDESLASLLEVAPPVDPAGTVAQIMGSGPNSCTASLRQVALTAFHSAREELIVTTPYFVPDPATAIAIRTAAMRGVATTIVVPARNDSPLVAAASRSHYESMLNAGVRVFEYERGLLHAKTFSIDREFAMISSANLDRRSFELNLEVSMVVYDSDFASELRFLQTSYLEDSREVRLSEWHRRGWPRRLWHNTAGMVSPLL